MHSIGKIVVLGAMATLLTTAAPDVPEMAEAGMPAPLPTQIPIRDISTPPSSNVTPAPFVPRAAPKRHRRTRTTKRRPAAHRTARPRTAPASQPAKTQNPALPKLEQRYEAPTESLLPLETQPANTAAAPGQGRKPAPVAFPPEPAPGPAPAPASQAAPTAAPAPSPTPAPAPGTAPAPAPAPAKP